MVKRRSERWVAMLPAAAVGSLVAVGRLVSQKHDETQWKGNLTSLFNTTVYDSDPSRPTLLDICSQTNSCVWKERPIRRQRAPERLLFLAPTGSIFSSKQTSCFYFHAPAAGGEMRGGAA